jgi:hypothetical protein
MYQDTEAPVFYGRIHVSEVRSRSILATTELVKKHTVACCTAPCALPTCVPDTLDQHQLIV